MHRVRILGVQSKLLPLINRKALISVQVTCKAQRTTCLVWITLKFVTKSETKIDKDKKQSWNKI